MLPSAPRPARVQQEGLRWPGWWGWVDLICLFLEVHLEHGLSKVYIFIFLYQGFMGVSREGRGIPGSVFSVGICLAKLNYILGKEKISNNVRRGDHGIVSFPGYHFETLSHNEVKKK